MFGFFPRLVTEKIMPSAEIIVSMATRKTSEKAMVNSPLNGSLARPHPSHFHEPANDPPTPYPSQEGNNPRRAAPLLGGAGGGFRDSIRVLWFVESLPQERENRLPYLGMSGVAEKLNDYKSKVNGRALSPLAGDVGQGESVRGVKAQKDQSLLTSAATK